MVELMHKNMKGNDNKGSTLVEMLITVFLFTIITGATYMVIRSGEMTFSVNQAKVELQQELRKAMNAIREDLRQSGSSTITGVPANGTSYTSIIFRKAAGVSSDATSWSANTTQYAIASGSRLSKTEGGLAKVVAVNISAVVFSRSASTPNIVSVTVQALKRSLQGNLTDSISFQVKMRN